jgi:DNA-binding transcriptional LysR family regulator
VDGQQARHFIAAGEQLHFARAAKAVGIPRAALVASIKHLEATLGYPLFDYTAETTTLTAEGTALLAKTILEQKKAAASAKAALPLPGGKAKASKGKGRAPAVKGEPRIGKRRQGR